MNALLLLAALSHAQHAVAKLAGTADAALSGLVRLEETKEGLKVVAELSGAPAGDHGFHIHEFGDCSDSAKAAGGHYNPKQTPHGHAVKDGPKRSHPGDMGNLPVAADGKGSLSVTLPKLKLADVAGRAMVVHEKNDDFSQPTGNAGGRIACGPIVRTAKP